MLLETKRPLDKLISIFINLNDLPIGRLGANFGIRSGMWPERFDTP
jgi:hypothetical protein